MTNVYADIISFETTAGFDDYLKRIHIMDIFKDVFESFPQHALKIVKFILYAYSTESEMLVLAGSTWSKTSEKIYNKVGLDPEILDVDMLLEHESTRSAINRWLQFQNEENWTQYITFRDLRSQYLEAALFPLPKYKSVVKNDDGIMIDQNSDAYARMNNMIQAKMNAAENSKKLLDMMKEALEKFIQKHPKLKDSVTALDKAGVKRHTTSVEDFIKET